MDLFGYTSEPNDTEEYYDSDIKIKIIGVGNGGNDAVNSMLDANIRGVEYITVNSDRQALLKSNAKTKIIIGERITRGHGADGRPEIGKQAAEENIDDLKQILYGAHMVFIVAGMGGGTGTGAAPVIAKLAKDMGILTIGIVTKPFEFEGSARLRLAEAGIEELKWYVDSLIVLSNEKLKQISENKITFMNALCHGVRSITDLINSRAIVNLNFADISCVMKEAGYGHMGVGEGNGKDKAEIAAKMAINSPLLEAPISTAAGILINFTVSSDISLDEIDTASALITSEAHPEAIVIWGLAFDENLIDTIQVTVIATNFQDATADIFSSIYEQNDETASVSEVDEEEIYEESLNIKVIGIGQCGCHAVNNMLDYGIRDVECITAACDRVDLIKSHAKIKIILGERLTDGRGANAKPEIGKQAAEETIDDLKQVLSDTNIVFLVAGMGRGTGTGATPVIAKLAKDMGIPIVGIVTKPFAFEGSARMRQAEAGIEELRPLADALIVIPNDNCKRISENKITLFHAFAYSNDMIRQCVQDVTDLIIANRKLVDDEDAQSIADLIISNDALNRNFVEVSSAMQEEVKQPKIMNRAKNRLGNP